MIKIDAHSGFVEAAVSGTLEVTDLQPLLAAMEDAHKRGPFVLLTDTLETDKTPWNVVLAFATALRNMPPMKLTWLGNAIVVKSAGVRFILSRLLLVAPLPAKAVKTFDHRLDALRWCASTLAGAQVEVPGALAWLIREAEAAAS
jgi:hypothetical protein